MTRAKNYENMFKFAKNMSRTSHALFPNTVYISRLTATVHVRCFI